MSKSSVSRTFGGRGVKPPAGVAAAITVIGGTLVVGGQPAAGASFVVTDAGDSGPGTLRQAIDDANASVNDADTITFDPGLAGSTITLTSGTLNISDDLTLTGLGEADLTLTTTDGDILYLYNEASLVLADITISGGRQDGVVARDSGDLTLSSVTVTASEQDGVKFDSRGSDLTIIDSTIDDNLDDGIYVGAADAVTVTGSSSSDNGDSGLYADDRPIGSFTVTDSTLDRNDSPGFYIDTSLGDVVITGSSISDNDDSGLNFYDILGGVTITDTTISNNNGDGLYADYIVGDLSIVGSTISGNTDTGIEIDESLFGDLIVTGSTFDGNDDNAIDVSTADGAVEISDTTISNNVDVGLYLRNGADGALTITDSTFDANGAAVRIDDEVDGDVNISRSAFTNGVDDDAIVIDDVSGNTVIDEVTVADNGDDPTDVALDVAATDGSVVVSNSTFSGNAGPSVAGPTVGSLDIVNSTFTANAGDAVVAAGGLTSIQHSTISGNTPTIAAVSSVDGAVTLDHTVATDNGAVPFFAATGTGSATTSFSMLPTGSAIGTGDVESDAPLLGPLADNGGETETLFPQPGSPVVDAGDPAISGEPEFDQRGVGRVAGTVDIGAVEINAGVVSVADVAVDEAAGTAVVTVTRSVGFDGVASVDVSTADGTAVDGEDFTGVTESVSWADGESGDKTVEIAIIDDDVVEGDESFGVLLSNPVGVSIDDGDGVVTITDDDVAADVGVVSSLAPLRFVDTRDAGDTFDDLFEGEGKRAGGSEYVVQMAGRGGVPADASAVVINVTAVAPEGNGFVTVHPCEDELPLASSLNFTAGVNIPNEIVAPLSADGELCVFASASTHILMDVVGFVDADSPLTPLSPARFLDTRAAGATFDGDDQQGGRTTAGGQVTLQVTDRGGVPADAVAVVANVTAVNPEGTGFVTAHPCEATPPNASSLNYVDGVNRANELIASVDADGQICLFTSTSTDLIVDIVGFVPAGSSFNAVGPARFLDTRDVGETVDGVAEAAGKRAAGSELELQISGRPGVPVGASAVVVNVTAVAPEATGFVTVHPCEDAVPNASSLNYVAGVNGANELIARLDADGKICLFTDQNTHLIVDVVAYLD